MNKDTLLRLLRKTYWRGFAVGGVLSGVSSGLVALAITLITRRRGDDP